MAERIMQNAAGNTIPAGYKQTEVGVIPEDWEVAPIGSVLSITTGARNTQDKVDDGRYPFFVRSQTVERINTYSFDGEAVLTAGDGVGTGKIFHYVNGKFDFHQRVYLMYNFGERVSGYFFYLYFSNNFFERIMSMTAKSSVDSVRREMIADMKMVLPSKVEQTAIAKVLSDSDALIDALEQLIAKKQAIKSATMQQLLTGRTRLPAFALRPDGTKKGYKPSELGEIPEDWCAATIHDITDKIIDYRGRTPKKLGMEWGGGNIPALSAGNVKKGFIDYQAECYFGSDELYRKWMTSGHARRDDIVFTMEAPLGNAALIPDDQMYILSQRTVLLQIARAKYNPTFIIHYFLSDSFQRYISDSATGSTAQGIKRTTFEKMYVAVPICIEEQTAIATILSDMDNELQTLTQKLDKARALKQGMMQQLLTGKIRLPLAAGA